MHLIKIGGFKPIHIIKMATHKADKILNSLDTLGTIEVGKNADVILLDKSSLDTIKNTLAICLVIKNGKVQERIKRNNK